MALQRYRIRNIPPYIVVALNKEDLLLLIFGNIRNRFRIIDIEEVEKYLILRNGAILRKLSNGFFSISNEYKEEFVEINVKATRCVTYNQFFEIPTFARDLLKYLDRYADSVSLRVPSSVAEIYSQLSCSESFKSLYIIKEVE